MKSTKLGLSFTSLLSVIVLLATDCGQDNSLLVARVAGRQITLKAFETEFARGKSLDALKNATLKEKQDFLERMIDKELKIIEAYQYKLDQDKEINEQVQQRQKGIIFNRLIERELLEKIIPESALKDYYKKLNKEIQIRQILVKFDPQIAEQKKDALRRAKDIVRKLKQGQDFARLAAEFSEDANTAKKGGDKGFLKWGPNSHENPVYVAAFSMKKAEISNPIETPNSYYIIQTVQIKEYPAPPYQQERERIRQQVYRMRNNEITEAYYKYMEVLKKKYRFQFNESSLDVFVKQLLRSNTTRPDSLEEPQGTTARETSPLDNFSTREKELVVANFQQGTITITDLINDLKRYPPHRRPRFKDKMDVQNFMTSAMVPPLLLEREAEVKNIKNDKEVGKLTSEFKESVMSNYIKKIQVDDKIKLDDAELKKYFEEHHEDYKNPESREVQQIFVKDRTLADDIVKKARRGEKFSKLFQRYNEKDYLKKDEGKVVITHERSGIGNAAFQIQSGDIADPVKLGDGYFVIKVLKINEPTFKTYEESQTMISSKLRRSALENREKEWLQDLRGRINYAIYEQNLTKSFQDYIGQDIKANE